MKPLFIQGRQQADRRTMRVLWRMGAIMNASMILAGVAGLAAVAGIVGGVLALAQRDIPMAVAAIVAGLTAAALLFGAGEGLDLLRRIERNTRASAKNTEPPPAPPQPRRRDRQPTGTPADFEFPNQT